ncbi:MAG TPA: redoxin domain-containing protein [Tepiditoga sp.]|nr:redoxin domain-containing protein [Thermotogota bacterium]HOO74277.1 redoxin domain-containing protein [Tepiditoga sp.]
MIKVGEKIPEFSVKDHNGEIIDIKSLRGKKILLSFHPLAFTGVCETQMKNLDLKFGELSGLNIVPLGFSVDSVPAKKAWAEQLKLKNLRLVSDFWPHGEISKKLGIFRENEGFSERANILVDEEGTVIWAKVYEMREQPDLNEIMKYVS